MIIEIKVKTNAKESKVEEKGGRLIVHAKAKPIQGKANVEVVSLLAEHFKTGKANVHIIRGANSSRKIVEILAT